MDRFYLWPNPISHILEIKCLNSLYAYDKGDHSTITEVTQLCLQHANLGTCGFYECLEQRFPCGHRGFSYHVGLHFCQKMISNLGQLNQPGLRWINGTARCMTGKLAPLYQGPFLRCSDIRDVGASAMTECNDREESDGTDFCWFVRENSQFYQDVFDSDDIVRILRLRSPRVVAKMVTEATQCGATALRDRVATFTSSVSSFFRNLLDGIDELLPWD